MNDPFTLEICVGVDEESRDKVIGAIRGIPQAKDRYGKFAVTVAASQVFSFYIGTYWRRKKRHPFSLTKAQFWLAAINPDAKRIRLGGGFYEYPPFWVEGSFEVLAYGPGKTTALRLLKWWVEWQTQIPRGLALATHLGQQIKVRGRLEPETMFQPGPYDIEIGEAPAPLTLDEWAIEVE